MAVRCGRYVQGTYFVESHRGVVESGLIGRDVPVDALHGPRRVDDDDRIYLIYPRWLRHGFRGLALLAALPCAHNVRLGAVQSCLNELTPLRYLGLELGFGGGRRASGTAPTACD